MTSDCVCACDSHEELLGALRELLEVLTLGTLEAAAKYGPDFDRDAADRHAVDRATAAIAKAEEATR